MIVVDADVLGRNRTGEETYVLNLLRQLPLVAPDLSFAAVTRHPGLVPAGVAPVTLAAHLQEVRMAWSLPRLLRRLHPELGHFQHALPLGWSGPSVVTLHDLHFERDPSVMGVVDRLTFKTFVPRAAKRATHVIAVSERTKRDAIELYGIPPERITVTPHGVDPAFSPGDGPHGGYLLFVGAVQARKDPLAAAAGGRGSRAAARRRRPGEGAGPRARAARPRRRRARLRRDGGARRPLPRRGRAAAAVALRGVRRAGARGDGERRPGRALGRCRAA